MSPAKRRYRRRVEEELDQAVAEGWRNRVGRKIRRRRRRRRRTPSSNLHLHFPLLSYFRRERPNLNAPDLRKENFDLALYSLSSVLHGPVSLKK